MGDKKLGPYYRTKTVLQTVDCLTTDCLTVDQRRNHSSMASSLCVPGRTSLGFGSPCCEMGTWYHSPRRAVERRSSIAGTVQPSALRAESGILGGGPWKGGSGGRGAGSQQKRAPPRCLRVRAKVQQGGEVGQAQREGNWGQGPHVLESPCTCLWIQTGPTWAQAGSFLRVGKLFCPGILLPGGGVFRVQFHYQYSCNRCGGGRHGLHGLHWGARRGQGRDRVSCQLWNHPWGPLVRPSPLLSLGMPLRTTSGSVRGAHVRRPAP